MTTDHRDRVGPVRAEMIDVVRERAERELNDERFAPWRRPGRRRLLVGAWLAAVAVTTVGAWFDWWAVLPLGLIVTLGVAFLLRRVVRGMADIPEELLDERMRTRRDRAYRVAYSILAAVALLPGMVLWLAADASRIGFSLEARHLGALMYLVLGVALALPSAILALTEDEL